MSDSKTWRNWRLSIDDENLAWLSIDVPDTGTNTLSRDVIEELEEVVQQLQAAPPAGLILSSGKAGSFVAGADINEFPKLSDRSEAVGLIKRGHAVFNALSELPYPTIACLDGTTLGGGLELALACDYRMMAESYQRCLGLPEVQLGIHPGLGGTVRAVQLLGVRKAMDLMLTGRSLSPVEALKAGLVDALIPPANWRDAAVAIVRDRPPKNGAGILDQILNLGLLRGLMAGVLRKQVAAKARPDHYPAPYAIIDLWRRCGANPKTGFDAEAESFADLLQTETSRNLVRVFFLQDGLKREPEAVAPDAAKVHVIGAGVMGGDIAAWCVLQGLSVTLQDRELQYIEHALERAAVLFEKRLRDPEKVSDAKARMVADVDGNGVADADVVIEAIFENLEAKQQLFTDLEATARPEALLVSNTSSIPLEQIATALQEPSRLAGLHFFNPVAKMPLIEIIYTDATATMPAAISFARQIGKLPLRCKSSPGFLVNRVLGPYLDEAMRMVEEGIPPEAIDRAAVGFGMPMGPVELADTVGLDIALHVAEGLAEITGRAVPDKLHKMIEDGQLGRKSGRGFYNYRDGRPEKAKNSYGGDTELITDRLVMALINEAQRCLDEGLVASVDAVDAGVIFGTGFAPFRGGPLHYARSLGAATVIAKLDTLSQRFGGRFTPAEGWRKIDE